jgi:hypothetical protein
LNEIYFPQIAVLGPWKTELGLVNYSSSAVIVTITAYRPDGKPFDTASLKNNPVTRGLAPGGSFQEDVATLFGFSGNSTLDGWIKIESTSSSVNGYVSYGSEKSAAAVASMPQGLTRALFSHIGTTQEFFTGVALLNPGAVSANVRVVALRANGQILGSFDTVLQTGQRISKLINELIPQAAGQAGGFIWVKSDQPIFLSELFGTTSALANVPPQPALPGYQPDSSAITLRIIPPLAQVLAGTSQQFQAQGTSGSFNWKVNGVPGGSSASGNVTPAGLYTAPATIPNPQLVTITADNNTQVAGATVDVLQKTTLVQSLGLIQSVAYLSSLQKLYTAELISSVTAKASSSLPPLGLADTSSGIFEIGAAGSRISLASFSNEIVSKMIPFTASDEKEYLLLAGSTTGRILRLDPVSKQSLAVFAGLNEPSAMVVDPVTGNLLVAEKDKITSIPRSALELGLTKSFEGEERASTVYSEAGATGITVDACSGKIYFTVNIREFLNVTSQLRVLDRTNGKVTVLLNGLKNPGQLLALYRSGVSCPSLHLFLAERTADRVALFIPADGNLNSWIPARSPADLAFLPPGSPLASTEGVLMLEVTSILTSAVQFAPALELYKTQPSNPFPPNLNSGVGVTLNPAAARLTRGATQQFKAIVTGTTNAAVNWSTTGGSVSPSGLYTAPMSLGTYTVRATSQADPSRFSEAAVQVYAVDISIAPASVTLDPQATYQFTATVFGNPNTAVTWFAAAGNITGTGLYTAPTTPGVFRVRVTSQADPSAFAEAFVRVRGIAVTITPPSASVAPLGSIQFAATVSGSTNTAVTWTATGGSINSAGLYQAPQTAGTYTIRATSDVDTEAFAQAVVTVVANVNVSISPSNVSLGTGASQQFNAAVSGSNNTSIIWTTTGGTVSSSGLYVSPQKPGLYRVRAASQADPNKFAEATVTVVSVKVVVSPSAVLLNPGGSQQFFAAVTGTSNTAVTWVTTGGKITSSGFYTAPLTSSTYTVRAYSVADPSKYDEAVVRLTDVRVSISPTSAAMVWGETKQFTATVTGSSNTAVTWSTTGGSVSSSGLYTAPFSSGTYKVRATSQADPNRFAEATVTVTLMISKSD